MGIELYWDNDDRTVMLIEVRGQFSWDEMYAVIQKIDKATANLNYEVGAILDVSEGLHFPGGSVFTPAGLGHAKNMLAMGKDGTGPMVVVGMDGMIRKIYDWFTAIDKKIFANVCFANSLSEAQAHLEKRGYVYRRLAAVGD